MKRRKHLRSWPTKVPTAEQLAKRLKRLQRITDVLTAKNADADFLKIEESKRNEISQLLASVTVEKKDLYVKAAARIDAIYKLHSQQYQAARGLFSQWFESIPDFKYSLPRFGVLTGSFSPNGTTGKSYGADVQTRSYGAYVQTQEVWAQVHAIELEYHEQRSRLGQKRLDERERLSPFKFGGYTVQKLSKVKLQLKATIRQLEQLGVDEQKLRRVYGVDDKTIAQAAAHLGLTRQHGAKIRTSLLSQIRISIECPYCGEELGDSPHADHIYPVALGGLSTPENMVLACSTCNLQKHDLTIREFASKFGKSRALIEERLTRLGKRT